MQGRGLVFFTDLKADLGDSLEEESGARSMRKEWVIHAIDRTQQQLLAQTLSISPITASVLLARGVVTKEQAMRWLSAGPHCQHDPFLLPDMGNAVDRLHRAVAGGERICFYGDYDVDGIAATSLYLSFFRSLGADAVAYIPHRMREGYGLHEGALRRLRDTGVRLLVASDCGTTAHKEVEAGSRLGLDFIITDHHQPEERLPAVLALLNPHRADSRYPFKGLCSGGLAYRVVQAYVERFGPGQLAPDSLLDLVALATVADVVPLQDENRIYVREGLRLIARGARPGIRAIKLVAGVGPECTAGTLAFRLAPRINAAGRLAHAGMGVLLLTTESEPEAKELAELLEALNRERQRIEERVTAEALVGVATAGGVLVVWSEHWHVGVVGIVAARLVEKYHRPAVVVAVNEQGIGKGSARSVPGFDLCAALGECRDLLDGFGGHPSAAGLTIQSSRLPELRERLAGIADRWNSGQPQAPVLEVDTEVELQEVNSRVVRELDLLHPYGAGNPEPVLAARGLAVMSSRVVGNGHLKLRVRQRNSPPFDGIGFRMGALVDLGLMPDRPMDLAFVPELNRWNGLERVQLRIRDLAPSQCGNAL
jgi:single-stranded-DNA-specific exonuclease